MLKLGKIFIDVVKIYLGNCPAQTHNTVHRTGIPRSIGKGEIGSPNPVYGSLVVTFKKNKIKCGMNQDKSRLVACRKIKPELRVACFLRVKRLTPE